MNAVKAISVMLAGVFLWGYASAGPAAETPANNSGEREESVQALRAMSCEQLDRAMAESYKHGMLYKWANLRDKNSAIIAKNFSAETKEYRARCKGEPVELLKVQEIARRAGSRPN